MTVINMKGDPRCSRQIKIIADHWTSLVVQLLILPASARNMDSIPGQETKSPYASGQLSVSAATLSLSSKAHKSQHEKTKNPVHYN